MQSAIKKVTFKEGLSLEVEVIPIAATISKHTNSITVAHRADFYNIFWIQKGTAEYLIDFEPVRVKENSFLFVNKDRVKALDQQQEHDGKILLFTDSFFAKSPDDTTYLHSTILFNDLSGMPVIDVQCTPALQSLFRQIEDELAQANDPYHYTILHNLLYNLLLLAERERRKGGFKESAKGADLDYTILFKDLLEKGFKALKSVTGYALQMNVSEKRLTGATTKTMGKSPKMIIDERVTLEAKRLLIHTNLSIKRVGYELGFEEPTNFIKYFRKHTAKTPLAFREGYINR